MWDDHRLALFRSKVTIRKKALSLMKDLVWKTEKKNNKLKQHQKRSNELISRKINFLSLLDGVSTTYRLKGISFYEQLFLGPLLLFPRRKSWRSEDPGKEVFFNVGFQLACTRLSVSANKRKMRASSHSKRAKNSTRKKGRACNHTSIHPYLVCNTAVFRVVTQRS